MSDVGRKAMGLPPPEEMIRRMDSARLVLLEHAPALRGELGPAAKKRAMEILAKAKRGE
jgi:hypothetical protein